jgi:uncharacterized protein
MITLMTRLAMTVLALVALAVVPVRAQTASQPPVPALWKIADEDTTIYLFGTIHVLPKGINWFGGKVADAFARSDSLVTEIAGHDDAKMQGLVYSMAMLPEGASLRGQLSEQERTAYEKALGAFRMPPALLDPFKPWYAAVALSTMPLARQGYSPEHGVEAVLSRHASRRGMPHLGLETVEYQLGLFDDLPNDVQKRYLGEVIGQLPNVRGQIGAMVEAWRIGDADELARLMNATESDPFMIETLLTGRNRTWAQWLDERLEQPGTVFVAVGAGHLAGPGSLQEQLAARGIATHRIQ